MFFVLCTKFSHKYVKRCLGGRSKVYSLAGGFYWCPAFADEDWDGIVEEATVAVSLHNTLPHRYNGFVIFHFTFLKASVNIYVVRLKKTQTDAQFIFSIFRHTCFGRISIPSSGGTPYGYNNWYLLFFLDESVVLAGLVQTQPGQQRVIWKEQ